MLRLIVGLWGLVALFGWFALSSALNGDTRNIAEGAIPAALVLVIAVPLTRRHVRVRGRHRQRRGGAPGAPTRDANSN
jgi:hypothetical protein